MRVLWVTPHLPQAGAGGGAAHEFELLLRAARHHEIELITSDLTTSAAVVDLGERAIPVEVVTWEGKPRRGGALGAAGRTALIWPTVAAQGGRDRVRSLSAAVSRHVERRPVDLVHLTHGEVAPVGQASSAPAALLLFDVRSRQLRREAEVARSWAGRAVLSLEARKVAAWERCCFSRLAGVASVSAVDRDALRAALGREVSLISNPVSEPFFARPAVERSRSTVTFVGNLAYRPNVDAVEWLAGDIWPLVRRERPDVCLELVGYRPSVAVERAAASIDAALHANVADVRPFYWRAAVAVAPVRLGSGLRNKILHAMACGAPVVATPTALEGIDARDGRDLWVARTADEIAAGVLAALRDSAEAQRRAAAARALLEEHRIDRVAEQFERWWASAADEAGRGR